MAKAKNQSSGEEKKTGEKKRSFEERLERLEKLGDEIRNSDLSLDDAIKAFEEGIVLARVLEKDLEKIEARIEVLMNPAETGSGESPELDLFINED